MVRDLEHTRLQMSWLREESIVEGEEKINDCYVFCCFRRASSYKRKVVAVWENNFLVEEENMVEDQGRTLTASTSRYWRKRCIIESLIRMPTDEKKRLFLPKSTCVVFSLPTSLVKSSLSNSTRPRNRNQ